MLELTLVSFLLFLILYDYSWKLSIAITDYKQEKNKPKFIESF